MISEKKKRWVAQKICVGNQLFALSPDARTRGSEMKLAGPTRVTSCGTLYLKLLWISKIYLCSEK